MTLEERIESAICGPLEGLGFDVVRIRYYRGERNTLQIMIDKISEGSISLGDCTKVSRVVSTIMDVEDMIAEEYHLEVTSPGIYRPLIKERDFQRFESKKAQVTLKESMSGIRKFKGIILGVADSKISFSLEEGEQISVELEEIESANLI